MTNDIYIYNVNKSYYLIKRIAYKFGLTIPSFDFSTQLRMFTNFIMWWLLEICPKISQNCNFIGLNMLKPFTFSDPSFKSYSIHQPFTNEVEPASPTMPKLNSSQLISIHTLTLEFQFLLPCTVSYLCVYIIYYIVIVVCIYIYVYTRIKCHVNSHRWLKNVVQQLGVWKWRIPTTWPWDHRENESHNKSRLIRIIHPPDFFRNSTCPSLLKNTAHVGDDSPSLAVRSQACWS